MSQWINYHHLLYFKIIAEKGSVTLAAKELRLGQSTLSAQLKQLEDYLGFALFSRENKKLSLTEEGKVVLHYAQSIFKLGDELVQSVQNRMVSIRPKLVIGATDSVPKQVMFEIFKKAISIQPCSVELLEGSFQELMQKLYAHEIDLVVSNSIPQLKSQIGFYHRVISRTDVGIYGSLKYKHLRSKFPKSLVNQNFVLPSFDSQLRYSFENWRQYHHFSINILAETQDTALSKLICRSGSALMPAASHTMRSLVLSGDVFEIGKVKGVKEELYLIATERKIKNKLAQELMSHFHL